MRNKSNFNCLQGTYSHKLHACSITLQINNANGAMQKYNPNIIRVQIFFFQMLFIIVSLLKW